MPETKRLTRREFVQLWLTLPVPLVLAACAPSLAQTQQATAALSPTAVPALAEAGAAPTEAPAALPPTPACGAAEQPTLAQTEGPYFTPNSPERASLLEDGLPGTRLMVSGQVLTTGCQPVAQALLDFWQADDAGQYDNVGYRLRGHQFTDDQGRYSLETIVPGLYPGRTRHIHVKVQAPSQPVLTTQVYFPNEPTNERDGIFRPELLMDVQDAADGRVAAFNFVLDLA